MRTAARASEICFTAPLRSFAGPILRRQRSSVLQITRHSDPRCRRFDLLPLLLLLRGEFGIFIFGDVGHVQHVLHLARADCGEHHRRPVRPRPREAPAG